MNSVLLFPIYSLFCHYKRQLRLLLQNMQTKVNEFMATKPIMSEFDSIFRHYTVQYTQSIDYVTILVFLLLIWNIYLYVTHTHVFLKAFKYWKVKINCNGCKLRSPSMSNSWQAVSRRWVECGLQTRVKPHTWRKTMVNGLAYVAPSNIWQMSTKYGINSNSNLFATQSRISMNMT